ncbi:MAG: ABC transporter substrate-binding protein [Treponema sp.]|nr:ABC transporter substrate-binding protein [Treponema sp.]
MNRTTTTLAVLLALLAGLSACAVRNVPPAASAETRIVTDVWGREVRIPAEVRTIVALGSGAPRIAAYLGVVDMMAGSERMDAETFSVLRDFNPVHHQTFRALPIVGRGGGSGNNNAYPEELIKLAPDVILAAFSPEAADELFFQTHIPVVSVRYFSVNFIDDSFYRAVRVFAEVVGARERGEEVLSFIQGHKAELQRRTYGIPGGEKPRVYAGAVTFNGRRGFSGTYSNFGPLMAINALNVADEAGMEGFFEANLEHVVLWDPDVIFLDPGNMDLVNAEYAANPAFFNSLRAVREGRVYAMPAFNFAATNVTYALMNAYFAGTVLFPERFAGVDIARISAEILTFFLGENTFDVMARNGLSFGRVTIGE